MGALLILLLLHQTFPVLREAPGLTPCSMQDLSHSHLSGHGSGQAKPKPGQSRHLWLGLRISEAKATQSQAKASGFQAKPSQNITTHDDMVLMFSIDGAQLYRSKTSDCWIYIWIIMDHAPGLRYKNRYVLPGGFIGGPNKPRNPDSYMCVGLSHLAAIQKEGLKIWDASRREIFVCRPFLAAAGADAVGLHSTNCRNCRPQREIWMPSALSFCGSA
jgi:hypothetical protein